VREKKWEEKEYILSMKAAHEVRWTEDATFVTFKEEPFSIRLSAEEEENGIFYGNFSLTFALEYAKKYLQKNPTEAAHPIASAHHMQPTPLYSLMIT
jgi:hypothetical protein